MTSAVSGTAELQEFSTHAFCSSEENGNYGSPNILNKCTESPPTLSTNNSIVWNLYLSWSNHLITSSRMGKRLEAFLIIETRRVIPTDTNGFCSPLASLTSTWVLWKVFPSSGLNCRTLNTRLFMDCPVVLKSTDLSFGMKRKQHSTGACVSPTILYSIRSL